MPHIPSFPPILRDWEPGNPSRLEPPLPRWAFNPTTPMWIPPEQRSRLEERYGHWAVRRAEAVLPRSATEEEIEAAARGLYESWWMRMPRAAGVG